MDTSALFGFLSSYFHESMTWKGYRRICVSGFLFISLFDVATAHLFNVVLQLPTEYRIYVLLATYLVPFIVYTATFIARRVNAGLFFSRKINIVFAYNLESVGDSSFIEQYNALIKGFENEIRLQNLGSLIRIVICPSDIRLEEETAAEAKTRLGLLGSTILVWGYVSGENKAYKFNTRFSYEFGHSQKIDKKTAKKSQHEFLQRILERGLFSNVNLGLANFNEQVLPTCYFILGSSAMSLNLFNRAEKLFVKFKEYYDQEQSVLRKRDLGPAYAEANELLVKIYQIEAEKLTSAFSRNIEKIREIAEKILQIQKGNYFGNILLAYYYGLKRDFKKAKEYSLIAESNLKDKNQTSHLFNDAFFYLLDRNFENAIASYGAIADQPDGVSISQITEFLGNYLDEVKDLPAFFASGYVNIRWADKKIGKKNLREFLRKSEGKKEYDVLIAKAKELLNQ